MEVPAKTRIAVPKISEKSNIMLNGKVIFKSGKPKKRKNVKYDSEDEQYIYFYVESGNYEIECMKE